MIKYLKFWEKVDKRGNNKCWFWRGSQMTMRSNDKGVGYGTFWDGSTNKKAHRISYEFFKGPIPKGLVIDHLCRKRNCVNPHHLEAVTHKENILRGIGMGAKYARKIKCIRGHNLTPQNIHIRKNGGRLCRICHRMRGANWRKKHPESLWAKFTPQQKEKSKQRVKDWRKRNPGKR